MTKLLNVGVIGVGGIAATHFPGWQASEHTELLALADLDAGTLARVGSAQQVVRLYDKPADLIADPDIDIVDICTPNRSHAPLAAAALEAGKHVICEKPLAPTTEEIRTLIEARNRSGKLLMTAQHFRFQGSAQALKAEIASGVLGQIYHARAWMLRRAGMLPRPTFIFKELSGGGPCIDIGVHILDLTLWMMGHPRPTSVSGFTRDVLVHQPGAFSVWGGAIPPEIDVEEFAGAFVRFENGATLMLEVSWLLHHKTDGEDMQMWLYGDKGGAHWPSNEILTTNNKTQQQFNTQLQRAPGGEAHAQECIAFADAIAHGKPSPVPPEDSLHLIGILEGLYRSAAEGKEVTLSV